MKHHASCAVGSGLLLALWPLAAVAQSADACAGLIGPAGTNTIISEARIVPAEGASPTHCLVRGVVEPRIGAGGKQYGSGFELRMPDDWSGRFLFQGGGGADGTVNPALGIVDRTRPEDAALSRRMAVASTDAGHYGDDPTDLWFGIDEKARIDNGYNSVRVVTERARDIMTRYYGTLPDHSYFMGCSNGGRQAMVAATRYPEYFDGVVAAAPAFDLPASVVAWNWNTRALKELADAEFGGNIAATFTDAQISLISDAAIEACDTADGADDNLVMAPFQCSFDPTVLQCGADGGNQCLSEGQVTVLQKILAGPTDSDGRQIHEGYNLAGVSGFTGMRLWTVGPAPGPEPTSLAGSFQRGWLRYFAPTPVDPDYDWTTFTPDDTDYLAQSGHIWSATSTDYGPFIDKGGKLLIWHGMADGAFSARHLARWYEKMQAENQGADFSRLYFTPGMHHCANGPGLTSFDPLSPLVDWVENGVAPGPLVATGLPPGASEPVTRPLCAYPARTVADGSGGFVCTTD